MHTNENVEKFIRPDYRAKKHGKTEFKRSVGRYEWRLDADLIAGAL